MGTGPVTEVCTPNNEYPAGDQGLQNAVACAAEKIVADRKSYFILAVPTKKAVATAQALPRRFTVRKRHFDTLIKKHDVRDIPYYKLIPLESIRRDISDLKMLSLEDAENEVSLRVLVGGFYSFVNHADGYNDDYDGNLTSIEALRGETEKNLGDRLKSSVLSTCGDARRIECDAFFVLISLAVDSSK